MKVCCLKLQYLHFLLTYSIKFSEEVQDQRELEAINDRYKKALRVFVENRFPQQTTRFAELLSCIPEVQAAATLVVQSKMFYVPLFLNTSLKSETMG